MSAAPFRIFVFTSEESNSVQSLAIGQPLIQVPVVHFPFPDQKIEVVRRGIGRSGDLELALSVEFHFGNRDTFVRRQLFILRRSKMGKRQDQTDDQAISRNESVSHRST